MLDTIIRFFQEGGPFMYPIALVLALGLAITLERFIYLGAVRRRNRLAFERGILPALQKRDFNCFRLVANSCVRLVIGCWDMLLALLHRGRCLDYLGQMGRNICF